MTDPHDEPVAPKQVNKGELTEAETQELLREFNEKTPLSDFWSEATKPFNAVMMVIALISLLLVLLIWYLSQQVAQVSYKIIQIPVVSSEGLHTNSPVPPTSMQRISQYGTPEI